MGLITHKSHGQISGFFFLRHPSHRNPFFQQVSSMVSVYGLWCMDTTCCSLSTMEILYKWSRLYIYIPSGYLLHSHGIDGLFIDGLPIKWWFSMAMLNNQMVWFVVYNMWEIALLPQGDPPFWYMMFYRWRPRGYIQVVPSGKSLHSHLKMAIYSGFSH